MKTFADQIRPFVPAGRTYTVLGTDGFGRSDSRAKLREFFEVDRRYVAVAALYSLMKDGKVKPEVVSQAIQKYGINPDRMNPVLA
jgi:pyruvate dehydrogenase E1 component